MKTKQQLSPRRFTLLLVFLFMAGLALILYPSLSDYWNSLHASRAIASYSETVQATDAERFQPELDAASAYNAELAQENIGYYLSEAQRQRYEALLNPTGNGMIGYLEIPAIAVTLPLFHGTEDQVLSAGIGHLEWSSLPVGGAGTHCLLSGHRGLPSAQLFSDLDKLQPGDRFLLSVLDQTLTYEVESLLVVRPNQLQTLSIEPGKDLCTLITCTPYGINTHRLLVRGHRVANGEDARRVPVVSEALTVPQLTVVGILFGLMLLLSLIALAVETALFRGCTALQNLGGNSYTNSRQFYNTPVLKLVDLRDCTALEAIGSECFSTTRNTCTFLLDGCTALRYIYSNAFADHGAAVPLDLSSLSALELIGSSAFGNSSSYGTYNQFTVLDLSGSESLETIGSYAFAYLPLQTVDFSGCASLRTIDANAFRNDLALVSANLSDCVNLETIGGNAFQDCTALIEVVIPASVTSVSESAFKNDSAVSRLTWNAKDYPTALGPQTFTSSNGFASGYELHIGQDTDHLPENFFEAVHSCGDIFFDGENELLVLPASATVGAPVPISGIDGTCYVDAYGVVYQLSEDGSAASVAYCPPGLTEYTVPATISVGGQEIPVTGVHPSAFILARDLAHVRFEDASAITEMGQSAFYGVAALTQVRDEASGQTVSTVSGAVGLFPNDYSALTEKNHVVTYKISLQSVGDGVITLNGADLFDRLPQTFGIFPWTAEDISLSYRTDEPEHVSFTGMDDWYLSTASPIPTLWDDDAEGQ